MLVPGAASAIMIVPLIVRLMGAPGMEIAITTLLRILHTLQTSTTQFISARQVGVVQLVKWHVLLTVRMAAPITSLVSLALDSISV